MDRYAYNLDPTANFVGWRPIVDGVVQPYTFLTYILVYYASLYSYEESKKRIEAYSRALQKYDFLAETGGYEKRADGSPVSF